MAEPARDIEHPSAEASSRVPSPAEHVAGASRVGNEEARGLIRNELLLGCGAPLLIFAGVFVIGTSMFVAGLFTGSGTLLVTGALLVIGSVLWPAVRLLSS